MNILVEIKNEYNNRVNNILSKLIYEGLNSIYSKSKEVSKGDDVLKIFQSFLKRVPKWNEEILVNELERIKSSMTSENFELLNILIKAALRSSYDILTHDMQNNKIVIENRKSIIDNFEFSNFIQDIYINCSKEIYNNPFLFYHNYSPVEIKRNQREILILIKKSIEESIKSTIPIELIVNIYISDSEILPSNDGFNKGYLPNYPKDQIDMTSNGKFIDQIAKKDLEEDIFIKKQNQESDNLENPIMIESIKKVDVLEPLVQLDEIPNQFIKDKNPTDSIAKQSDSRPLTLLNSANQNELNDQILDENRPNIPVNESFEMKGGNQYIALKDGSMQDKINNIIDEKSLNLSKNSDESKGNHSESINRTFINPSKVESINETKKSVDSSIENRSSIKQALNTNGSNISQANSSYVKSKSQTDLDSKLEKLLKNDLGDSDTESSFNPNGNESNYQEVFSNSNLSNVSSNTADKNDEINKNKFFSNYLQL